MTEGAARVYTATVVAIVSPHDCSEIAEALSGLSRAGVRPVIISLGDNPEPGRRDDGAIVIDGLLPKYLDNAVACLRLSSLPTLVWWRAGDPQVLERLAALVDRVVLDTEDPSAVWPLVPQIARLASVSDLRWTRLTRWRDMLAQCFDIPDIRASAGAFDHLRVTGSDPYQARLVGGWLRSRLPARDRLAVQIETEGAAAIASVQLWSAEATLGVRLVPHSTCLETFVEMGSAHSSRRVAAAGDQRRDALIAEELRVRSRDIAFEDALRAAEGL